MTTEFGSEPTLRTYLVILRQQRWWIICLALLGIGAGVAVSAVMPKRYTATAQVLVQPTDGVAAASAQQSVAPPDIQTALQLVTSAPVQRAVQRRLGSMPGISASEVAQTNVISIAATSTSPAWSARVANAYAQAFVRYQQTVTMNNLTGAENQLRSQIAGITQQIRSLRSRSGAPQATALANQEAVLKEQLAQLAVNGAITTEGVALVTPAQRPVSPSSPGLPQDAGLGLLAGLVGGVAVAFLRNHLNDTLTSKEAVEELGGAPVLTYVPLVSSWKRREQAVVVSVSEPTSPVAEAYRSLRTSLQFARHERDLRTILVTSPAASEGKSCTTINLGIVFAQAGERTLIVSCDLRRPRVGQYADLPEDVGFTTVLLGQHTLDDALLPAPGQPGLWVLPAGKLPHNPAELLASTTAAEIFSDLRTRFDLVLMDSPPLLPVTDAAVLSKAADATLLVVAAGQTRRADLRRAAEKLQQVNAPVVGIVLNQVTKQVTYGYGLGYGYGHGHGYKAYPSAVTEVGGRRTMNGNGSGSGTVPSGDAART